MQGQKAEGDVARDDHRGDRNPRRQGLTEGLLPAPEHRESQYTDCDHKHRWIPPTGVWDRRKIPERLSVQHRTELLDPFAQVFGHVRVVHVIVGGRSDVVADVVQRAQRGLDVEQDQGHQAQRKECPGNEQVAPPQLDAQRSHGPLAQAGDDPVRIQEHKRGTHSGDQPPKQEFGADPQAEQEGPQVQIPRRPPSPPTLQGPHGDERDRYGHRSHKHALARPEDKRGADREKQIGQRGRAASVEVTGQQVQEEHRHCRQDDGHRPQRRNVDPKQGEEGDHQIGVDGGNVLIDHQRKAHTEQLKARVLVALYRLSAQELYGRQYLLRLVGVRAGQFDLVEREDQKEDQAQHEHRQLCEPGGRACALVHHSLTRSAMFVTALSQSHPDA